MIVFSKLGEKGNIGNQLFQIASTIGLATLHGHKFAFPKWEYSHYFQNQIPVFDGLTNLIELKEESFKYYKWKIGNDNYDLNGWLQSEKYFDKEKVKNIFIFKTEYVNKIYSKYAILFEKKTILLSVRRGDFVNNTLYYQLTFKYYFLALKVNFPNWEKCNIVFLSDDINYCKYHFSFLNNAFFIEDLKPIEQLILGTMCDDFIISNSTFSWWLAWLGEKNNSLVIRPKYNFGSKLIEQKLDVDFFPDRWLMFDYRKKQINIRYYTLILKGGYFNFKFNFKYYFTIFRKKIKKILQNN